MKDSNLRGSFQESASVDGNRDLESWEYPAEDGEGEGEEVEEEVEEEDRDSLGDVPFMDDGEPFEMFEEFLGEDVDLDYVHFDADDDNVFDADDDNFFDSTFDMKEISEEDSDIGDRALVYEGTRKGIRGRTLASCSKDKKVALYKFCIEGDCDTGPHGEHRLKLDGEWLWNGYKNFREGQCHNLKVHKTVSYWKTLTVGTEEHDSWSENDSYFATMPTSKWYSNTCGTYTVMLAKQHKAQQKWSSCVEATGSYKTAIEGSIKSEKCSEWSQPSESFIWHLKIEPKTSYRHTIQSVSSGNYLDGRNPEHTGIQVMLSNSRGRNPATDGYFQWELIPAANHSYNIRSISSGNYLDGRNPEHTGIQVMLNNSRGRNPATDRYFQWKFIRFGDTYAIRSVSSGNYLDGRNPEHTGIQLFLTNRNPNGDNYLQWRIRQYRY